MWLAAVAGVGALVVLTGANVASARVGATVPTVGFRLAAHLTSAQVTPAPAAVPSNASGQFTAVLIRTRTGEIRRGAGGVFTWRLVWRLTVSGLSSPATSAQIAVGTQGEVGAQIAALCSPCTIASRGSMELSPAQASSLLKGSAYVQVATVKNPSGEIRGQIHRVRTLPVQPGGGAPRPPQPAPKPSPGNDVK